MMMGAASVIVVDDDAAVGSAVGRLLRSAGYEVQVFERAEQVFAGGRPARACCLILDVQMAAEDGLSCQRRLKDAGVEVPIVFLSGHGDIPTSVRAMKAGAVDFLTKPFDADRLLGAVATAVEADDRLLRERRVIGTMREEYGHLTAREREVFANVAAGMLNKQIAMELGISEKTVKVHRARVMEKMRAESLADLVRMADLLGILRGAGEARAGEWEDGEPVVSAYQSELAELASARGRG